MASVAAEPPPAVPSRSSSRSRSPEVKAFTALLCGAAACLVAGVLFPMTPEAPRTLATFFVVVALAMAVGTWFLMHNAPRGV
jgi:hypothetical protein